MTTCDITEAQTAQILSQSNPVFLGEDALFSSASRSDSPPRSPDSSETTGSPSTDAALDSTEADAPPILDDKEFRGLVRTYLKAADHKKAHLREFITTDIAKQHDGSQLASILVDEAIASAIDGRIGDAISVLCDDRVDLSNMLHTLIASKFNSHGDDAVYIVVRACGYRHDPASRHVVHSAAKCDNFSAKEAAIESLAEINTALERQLLRDLSSSNAEHDSLRLLAKECLSDIEG